MNEYSLTQQLKNFGITNIEVLNSFTREFGDKTNFSNGIFNYKIQVIDVKKQDDCTVFLLLMEKCDKKLSADDFRKETFVLLAVADPSRRKWLFTGDCFFSSRLDWPVKYGGSGLNLREDEKWEGHYKQKDPITGKTPGGADSELDYFVRYGNYLKFNKIIEAHRVTDDTIAKAGYLVSVSDEGHEYFDGVNEEFVGEFQTPRSSRAKSMLWIQGWKEEWKWKHWECLTYIRL